jgi:hypothetical protein
MGGLKRSIHHLLKVIKQLSHVATMELRSSIWKDPERWQRTPISGRTDPAA